MGKYLKMADVFGGKVTANHGDDNNGWSAVDTSLGLSIDESGDGGFKARTADYVAHAINSHDELVENMQHYKQDAEQWEARAVKEASMVQEFDLEVERLRRQLHFCEASRGQLIDQVNKMKRDVFEGKYQQKPYL